MELSADDLARFVEESCRRQGVPVRIDDVRVVDQVVTLLRSGPPGCGRQPAPDGPHRSESPLDLDPPGIERLASPLGSGSDHDTIHDGLDDRTLTGEVQSRPRSA